MRNQLADPLVVMALEQEAGELFQRSAIAVFYTGVGKVNAAYALTRRLGEYQAEGHPLPLVINFGTAGSHSFPVGKLVVCRQFVQRDMDVTALDFEIGATPFDLAPALLEFPPLLEELPHGICGTGDSFATTHAHDVSSRSAVRCDVVDMEAFALAKVCWFYGCKFAAFKYITDGANGEAGRAWQENLRNAAERFVAVYDQLSSKSRGSL